MTKDISFLILLLLLLYFCVNFIHPAHDDRFTELTYVCVFSRQSSSFLSSLFFSFGLSFTDTSWNKNMVILFDNQSNWWLILFPKQSSEAKHFQVYNVTTMFTMSLQCHYNIKHMDNKKTPTDHQR